VTLPRLSLRLATILTALTLSTPALAARCCGDFGSFIQNISAEAQGAGISANVVSAALGGVQQDMAVRIFDRRQRGTSCQDL
jgi:membrane-bound lytic murein transglycosylase B